MKKAIRLPHLLKGIDILHSLEERVKDLEGYAVNIKRICPDNECGYESNDKVDVLISPNISLLKWIYFFGMDGKISLSLDRNKVYANQIYADIHCFDYQFPSVKCAFDKIQEAVYHTV